MTEPRGSVGEITDPNVKILGESGRECPPARLDPDGKILNYAEAVGEIVAVVSASGLTGPTATGAGWDCGPVDAGSVTCTTPGPLAGLASAPTII